MRTTDRQISWTSVFKRDFKREKKKNPQLETLLSPILSALAADAPLEPRYHDHALTGDWKDYRDCHVKPDLVLIYQKPEEKILLLVRLGSHSELDI